MKAFQKYVFSLNALLLLAGLFWQDVCSSQETNALEQRVKRWDVVAIRQAADQGHTEMIPALESAANASVDPDEPVRIWAKAALAKLGVRKYMDETVAELTTTNSELFAFYMKNGICAYPSQESRVACATERTQETAFKKLAYIHDPSTVKIVAQFLYSTEHFQFSPDVPPWWASGYAYMTLRQMVDNPPALPTVHTHEEEVRAWQQWWKQNKDKYP
jgi:hypothetical protein